MPRAETGLNDRAIVMLPWRWLATSPSPRVCYKIIGPNENVPDDPAELMMNTLREELSSGPGIEYATNEDLLVSIRWGEPVVVMLNGDDGHPVYDQNHDQHAICRCGHHYIRHFDPLDDHRPGCKYCTCQVFELDPDGGEKHPDLMCIECRGNLNPDGRTCAKCRREVGPWGIEALKRGDAEAEAAWRPTVDQVFAVRAGPYHRIRVTNVDDLRILPPGGKPASQAENGSILTVVDFQKLPDGRETRLPLDSFRRQYQEE